MISLLLLLSVVACDKEAADDENKVVIDGETYSEVLFTLAKVENTPFDGKSLPESYPLEFFLMREETEEIVSYTTEVTYEDKEVHCCMLVPETAPVADGNYLLLMVFHTDKKRYPFQLELTFKDHTCVAGAYTEFYQKLDGEGTLKNPYKIKTYKDLLVLHTDSKKDLTRAAGKYFKQQKDIDLNDYYKDPDRVVEQGWESIASGFSGTFDGNGTVIYNLMSEAAHDTVGFFHSLGDGAVVKDVSFSSVSIDTPGRSCVGVIAGATTGRVTLEGINVAGNLFASKQVGGFIGAAEGSVSIENCSNEGLYLKSGGGNAGGFIGSAKVIDIKETTLCAKIESEGDYTGGVVGSVSGINSSFSEIDNSSSLSIKGVRSTGGLAGAVSGSYSIKNVVLEKTATSSTTANAISGIQNTGGFIGETSLLDCASISDSRVQLRLKGESNTGGFVGKVTSGTATLQIIGCSSGTKGNVEGVDNTGGVVGLSECALNIRNEKFDDAIRFRLPVVGTGRCAGGVVGQVSDMTLTHIIAGANVTGNDIVGGFFGEGDTPKLIRCATDSTIRIQGKKNVGGVGGSVYAPSIQSGSDFSAQINPDDHYAGEATCVGGLFGYARSARIDGVSVRSKVRGADVVGGLVGLADERVTFSNCVNYATIDAGNEVGGLVGKSLGEYLSVEKCRNYGSVAGRDKVGGIVGHARTDYLLKDAHNRADVTGSGDMAGGICAFSYYKSRIESCTNTGKVSAKNRLGGIVGSTDSDAHKDRRLTIVYCANKGEIKGDNKSVGGLAGFLHGEFVVQESYNEGAQSGKENIGGIVGEISGYYTLSLGFQHVADCYNTGASSGDTHRAGIIGYKGADAGIGTLGILRCYNSASTGWGILGGISNTASYNYDKVYYSDANSGDFSKYAKRCSPTQLKSLKLGNAWASGPDGYPALVSAATFTLP